MNCRPKLIQALIVAFCVANAYGERAEPDLVAGCLYSIIEDIEEPYAIPLESSVVVVDIAPGVVETTVSQTFANRTEFALECVYLFPLPEDATITDMELRYADRVVKSVVQEKVRAKATYDAAKAAGKKTALLESARPNLFSNSVANFLPGETVEVRFSYMQELRYRKGRYSYRFPIVAGARYFPERPVDRPNNLAEAAMLIGAKAVDTLQSRLVASRSVAGGVDYPLAIGVRAEGLPIRSIKSPSHPSLNVERPGDPLGEWRAELAGPAFPRDRDLVIEFELYEAESLLPSLVASQTPTGNYGALTLFPPSQSNLKRQSPARGRDIIFLVDHSGSMGRGRMKSAREGVVRCLEALGEGDRFNIAIFDDDYEFYSEAFVAATPEARARAGNYARNIQSDGGTVMLPALRACLNRFEASSENERLIVFLTDGDVGNERELVRLLRERLGSARLFTFGIGEAPNEFLIEQMAVAGRGQARFIMDDRAVAREIEELFQAIGSPALADIELRFLDAEGREMEIDYLPRPIANVYAGNPVQVVFRSEGAPPAAVELAGAIDGARETWRIELAATDSQVASLEPLFGRRWIDSLFLDYYAADSDEESAAVRSEIVAVSELMQLVTEFTSRVAVEDVAPAARALPTRTVRLTSTSARPTLPIGSSGSGAEEIFELSPFTVEGSEDAGYRATSTLAGGRIRTSLKDVASSISVFTEQFLRDTATTSVDDLLLYSSGTESAGLQGNFTKPRMAPVGASGLGGEGESAIVDPIAIARIDFPATPASAVGSVLDPFGEMVAYSKSPDLGDELEIGARWSDGGYRSVWLDGNRELVEDDWSARLIASRSERVLRRDRVSLASRAQLSSVARVDAEFALLRYGRLVDGRRASAVVTLQDAEASRMFQYEFVWSENRNSDPFAFGIERQGSAASDELASDDLLFLAQTERQGDRIHSITTFAEFDGRALAHSVNATARHRETFRAMRFAHAGGTAFEYGSGDFETIVSYQARDEERGVTALANVATSSFEHPDSGRRSSDIAWDAGVSWRLSEIATLHARYAEAEQTPRIVTRGLVYLAENDSWALASPLGASKSRGWDARVQFADRSNLNVLSFGYFRRDDDGRVARDWLSESRLREVYRALSDPPAIDHALVNFKPFSEEGVSVALVANPTYAWSLQMDAYWDWHDADPVSGGNRRGSVITRYVIWEGPFDSLTVGGGARYRNEMRYADGFRLMGGWSGDLFLAYEFGREGATTVQLNTRSLGGEASRVSRYDADASAETMLTVSHRF